ncbi:hypothetical protein DB346_09530 [Verrucomicrobia bacterium LW23]|nr:hypothetical protein DB346_09530 [Verrucomicrobia bacterium LW23]
MKKVLAALSIAIVVLSATALTASAQNYTSGRDGKTYRRGTYTEPSYMEKQRAKLNNVNPQPDLSPEETGAGTAVWKKGPVMISPFAPARYGMGSKYLAAAPFPRDAAQDNANEARYTFGGIKLFGYDF